MNASETNQIFMKASFKTVIYAALVYAGKKLFQKISLFKRSFMKRLLFLILIIFFIGCANDAQNSIEIPKKERGQWYEWKDGLLVCTVYADSIVMHNYDDFLKRFNPKYEMKINQKFKLTKKVKYQGNEYLYFFKIPDTKYYIRFHYYTFYYYQVLVSRVMISVIAEDDWLTTDINLRRLKDL